MPFFVIKQLGLNFEAGKLRRNPQGDGGRPGWDSPGASCDCRIYRTGGALI